MSDAVSRLITDRGRIEDDFRRSVVTSSFLHVGFIAAIFGVSLFDRDPPLRVMDGFAVVMPRGGGGAAVTRPAPPVEKPPQPEAKAETQPAPAPKVVKPPKEQPNPNRLRDVDAKKTPPSKKPAARVPGTAASAPAAPGGGVGIVPGPGVPDGTDVTGDWYLSGVQRKIWAIWMQQIHTGMTQSAVVAFSIAADGSVSDVKLVQSSGSSGVDFAAQRAIYSAQPFGPIPKNYGTNRISIQGSFTPDS